METLSKFLYFSFSCFKCSLRHRHIFCYIKRIFRLEGVTQKSRFRRNRFCRVTLAQFIRYLKSFYKANLDINKPLRLWVFMKTIFKSSNLWVFFIFLPLLQMWIYLVYMKVFHIVVCFHWINKWYFQQQLPYCIHQGPYVVFLHL